MHIHHSTTFYVATLLLLLPASIQASFLGTLLFGKDTLDPVRAAIKQTEQLRDEMHGWYKHNATQQANFTVTPDPADLYTLQPALYSGRSLVEPDGSYYTDVEGYYKGEWTGWDFSTKANRSLAIDSRFNHTAVEKLSAGQLNEAPDYVEGVKQDQLIMDRGAFDWLTIKPGHVDVHLREEHLLPGNVSLITGSISFAAAADAKSSIDSVDFSLEGLHFIPTGSIFLHAVADEAPEGTDVRTSLGLIPQGNNETANATISAIDKAFQLRIDMLQRIIASGSYDAGDSGSDSLPAVKHNCSLHIYGQFHSAGPYTELQPQIDALEREAKLSTGISTISPPPLKLALTSYSPECQLVLTSQREHELAGVLQSRLWKKAVNYAIIYFVILFVQTHLLVQQMEVTTTPSGLAKMSDKTWLAQSVLDAYGCLIHLSVAVAVENETTVPLIACAFMSGMCFLAFGYRYTITIYRSQMDAAPSPTPTPTPAAAAPAAPAAPAPTQQAAAGLPGDQPAEVSAPNTTESQAPSTNPIASAITAITNADAASATPEEIAARRRGATILFVGVFLLMVGFFPIFTVTLMLPFLYSFWIPQIYRNVTRGTRKAILKRVVIGTTITRMYIPLYLLVCPANVLFSEPSVWGWVLAGYLVVQALVLVGQDLMGPHWFLPKKWVPEDAVRGWEYHPPLDSGRDIEEEGQGREYGDCAICLTAIENKSKARRRNSKIPSNRSSGQGWFSNLTSISSSHNYRRIADENPQAEDFDLEDETMHQTYPPEKLASGTNLSHFHPHRYARAGSTGTHSSLARKLRSNLAKLIRTSLRWKHDLGTASSIVTRGSTRRRMDVMQAPCQHAFHTECLERWLEIKNECPSCRSVLPPV
ncbi:related to TUL1 - Golgi-localized RING-finger ubiquitin ligase [Ustilago trichophora]|uniref:RING-type E3 ubiquitin transferase n=1 Tax=Ustilago trichophora TaxID=86804 RepID=A0A5C3EA38_9BASI|nr:related to TUL1 - Golgi-localized RING-finger ubiquitin ligase [Ustilago trichophora]